MHVGEFLPQLRVLCPLLFELLSVHLLVELLQFRIDQVRGHVGDVLLDVFNLAESQPWINWQIRQFEKLDAFEVIVTPFHSLARLLYGCCVFDDYDGWYLLRSWTDFSWFFRH